MGLALSSVPGRFLPRSAGRDATASPLVHLTKVVRKDSMKPGKKQKGKKKKRKRGGGGGMQEGSILT